MFSVTKSIGTHVSAEYLVRWLVINFLVRYENQIDNVKFIFTLPLSLQNSA